MTATPVFYLILIIFSCIFLVKSVELMVKSSSSLAKAIRVSEYSISIFLIAAATSFPELIFGITSAINNNSLLSFGNVIGSNIADLTLVVAIPILIGGMLPTGQSIRNKDLSYAGLFSMLPIFFILDNEISRGEGIALLFVYVAYLVYVFHREKGSENQESFLRTNHWAKNTALLLFSGALMLVSAQILVKSSIGLSELIHIPAIFIGLTLTAVGTSIPELAFGLKVIKTKFKNEIMGSILGSVVVNSTLVVGVTAIISPIKKEANVGNSSILFLALCLIVFIFLSLSGRKLSRVEAVILAGFYIVFVFMEKSLAGI